MQDILPRKPQLGIRYITFIGLFVRSCLLSDVGSILTLSKSTPFSKEQSKFRSRRSWRMRLRASRGFFLCGLGCCGLNSAVPLERCRYLDDLFAITLAFPLEEDFLQCGLLMSFPCSIARCAGWGVDGSALTKGAAHQITRVLFALSKHSSVQWHLLVSVRILPT